MKPYMYCSCPILKYSGYCFRDEDVASLIFNYKYILNKNHGVCYRKSLLNPGIQVWLDMEDTGGNLLNVQEALLT